MAAKGGLQIGVKRRRKSFPYRVVLLDIEGTTTPITFVKDTLFPYVRDNVERYLNDNWTSEDCQQDINLLREQAEKDKNMEGAVSIPENEQDPKNMNKTSRQKLIASTVESVLWLMDADCKVTALKQLQGHIWKKAYEDGEIKGEVYDDVVPALDKWTSSGFKVFIYSSGSVAAQKLLFKYSDKGDLLKYFSGHFDTKIGSKVESASYRSIAKSIGEDDRDILFVTDVVKEAKAATEAGVSSVVSVRSGNAPLSEEDKQTYKTITSFDELIQELELEPPETKKKTVKEADIVEAEK